MANQPIELVPVKRITNFKERTTLHPDESLFGFSTRSAREMIAELASIRNLGIDTEKILGQYDIAAEEAERCDYRGFVTMVSNLFDVYRTVLREIANVESCPSGFVDECGRAKDLLNFLPWAIGDDIAERANYCVKLNARGM